MTLTIQTRRARPHRRASSFQEHDHVREAIYDTAPLGALIKFSDGTFRPPARFTRKLAVWERSNGSGRLIRKTPPFNRGAYASEATFTLHEGDFGGGGIVLVVVHRKHSVDSPLRFEIVDMPRPGAWRVVHPYGETTELLHLADDRVAAEGWLKLHRYADAWIEPVASDTQAFAAASLEIPSVQEAM